MSQEHRYLSSDFLFFYIGSLIRAKMMSHILYLVYEFMRAAQIALFKMESRIV